MSVSCACCVLSGTGLCDELITRPEDSCGLWCVVVCDLENLVNEEALAHWGAVAPQKNCQYEHRRDSFTYIQGTLKVEVVNRRSLPLNLLAPELFF